MARSSYTASTAIPRSRQGNQSRCGSLRHTVCRSFGHLLKHSVAFLSHHTPSLPQTPHSITRVRAVGAQHPNLRAGLHCDNQLGCIWVRRIRRNRSIYPSFHNPLRFRIIAITSSPTLLSLQLPSNAQYFFGASMTSPVLASTTVPAFVVTVPAVSSSSSTSCTLRPLLSSSCQPGL